jgi:hypothetical protein
MERWNSNHHPSYHELLALLLHASEGKSTMIAVHPRDGRATYG